MMTIAVTGADGFIGIHLCSYLEAQGYNVIRIVRHAAGCGRARRTVEDISLEKNWSSLLRDVDVVIHLAARAHVVREIEADPLATFRRVNVDATRSLAEAASALGIRRFVFLSSIGVNGNQTFEAPFRETDVPAPIEAYAVSKWEAEQALRSVAKLSGMEVVVVRPPLVYGPGVKGNFLRLLQLVKTGVPLPFGAISNARSFVGIFNLCDLLTMCAVQSSAADGLFLVSDGEDVSVQELLRTLASSMGRPSKVFRCPPFVLSAVMSILGRREELRRLTTDLRVDSRLARQVLGWRPKKSLKIGLDEMARWYLESRGR